MHSPETKLYNPIHISNKAEEKGIQKYNGNLSE